MRRAFTLVELLVVITIIGMLASIALGGLYLARNSARVAKTQSTITKLDDVIQARYNEFLTRRLPLRNRRIPPDAMAELRCRMLREIVRMEMPDRLTDITYPKDGPLDPLDAIETLRLQCTALNRNTIPPAPVTLTAEPFGRTPLARRFFRHAIASDAFLNGPDPKYDSAECLYMIVSADVEARERFQDNEIGDVDGDGFFEFIDGWGKPIQFLRWAPGFRSDLQTGDAEKDHDPFDPRRIGEWIQPAPDKWERPADVTSFRLVPLIYSAGPDGEYGLEKDRDFVVEFVPGMAIDRVWTYRNSESGLAIGEPTGDGSHLDNITNHSLGMN